MESGSISVVPNRCREALKDKLVAALASWCNTWFADACQVDVTFNDTLFLVQDVPLSDSGKLKGIDFQQLANIASGANQLDNQQPDEDFVLLVEDKLQKSLLQQLCFSSDFAAKTLECISDGAAKCSLSLGGDAMGCLFLQLSDLHRAWPELFKLPAKSSKPLVQKNSVVQDKSIELSFSLTGIDLSFGEILNLKKGDVLKLKHPLDQPLRVKSGDNRLALSPFLVKDNQRKAVLLGN